MKYYIIAGEASGDLHGSNLMKELKIIDNQAEFRFWGGNLMQNEGGILVKHFKDLAFMGFLEVIKNLPTILKNISFCKKDILEFMPDRLIMIDYPGFNLRIADFAKKNNIDVHFYISPQLWAWKPNRVYKIKENVKKMYVILPFEKDWYKKYDYDVEFVGHPLLDAIKNFPEYDLNSFKKESNLNDKPIIALLPGSRKQEINKMLEIMLSVRNEFQDYQFVIAGAPSIPKEMYERFLNDQVKLVSNQTYKLLKVSKAALVTSGTATLETALFEVPEIVCYKGSEISYQIGKRLIKHIKYISLVNLILDKELVKELIQKELTTENLIAELHKIIEPINSSKLINEYKHLKTILGGEGASKKVAEFIFKC